MNSFTSRAILCSALLAACSETPVNQGSAPTAFPGPKPNAPQAAPGAAPAAEASVVLPPKADFTEEDFAESDHNRDPFRSYQDLFVEHPVAQQMVKQPVVLENFALDDLKLIGVVTGIVPAKAMLVDPGGKGHVIQRNDLVGRAERVQSGSSNTEYQINWRVDQIRESDVVFVREDPSNPDVPSATRVIALRTKEEEQELNQPN
ncbi:MAG TPA: pilus assembly protein PilP [Polyangiaceae bacterium]|jgi:type IV pilus assembly protein PilP|nr:pilus assembly protein PilP [Polyangiaceae bacterium]